MSSPWRTGLGCWVPLLGSQCHAAAVGVEGHGLQGAGPGPCKMGRGFLLMSLITRAKSIEMEYIPLCKYRRRLL